MNDYSTFELSVGGNTQTITSQTCYKKGNLIHIEFYTVRTAEVSINSTWGVIPSGYRPSSSITTGLIIRGDGESRVCACTIDTDGYIYEVQFNTMPADVACCFYIEYPIN